MNTYLKLLLILLSITISLILVLAIFAILEFRIFTNTNFHKLIHPRMYTQDIDREYNENEEFVDRVNIGKDIARKSKIVICGLCRDTEHVIVQTLNRLRKTTKLFNEYKIVIFENDSKDNTRNIIKKERSKDKNIILLDCCEIDCDCKLGHKKMYDIGAFSEDRIYKMAVFRNHYLDYVKKNLSHYDYMLVVDMDLDGEYSDNGILHSISFEFDAIAINGRCSLAGTFGLSTIASDSMAYKSINKKYKYNDIMDKFVTMNKEISNTLEDDYYANRTSLISVISAFNGIAIYKVSSILEVSYSSKTICEHLDLHENMIDKGYDKIYLNPYFLGYFNIQGDRNDLLYGYREQKKIKNEEKKYFCKLNY